MSAPLVQGTPEHRALLRRRIRAGWARIKAGEGFIYLAEVIGAPQVKIGFSLDPKRRVKDCAGFGLWGPRRLLHAVPGSLKDEQALHRTLRPVREAMGWGRGESYPRSILNHPAFLAVFKLPADFVEERAPT